MLARFYSVLRWIHTFSLQRFVPRLVVAFHFNNERSLNGTAKSFTIATTCPLCKENFRINSCGGGKTLWETLLSYGIFPACTTPLPFTYLSSHARSLSIL
jgi:hypothetical protein